MRARERDAAVQKTMDETLSRRLGLRRVDGPTPLARGSARPPAYAGVNAYVSDPVLTASLDPALDEGAQDALSAFGTYWGSAEAQEVARIATANRPTLRTHDAEGERIDQLEIHPAYHALMNRSVVSGLLSSAWEEGDERNQHRLRAATLFLTAQCERGHLVPVAATHAAVAALAYAPDLEADLFPLIASRRYDRRPLPLADKEGVTVTLALSERGAGVDRGAVETEAETVGGDGVRVTGEKWFVCAPASDMALVLARTVEGPTAVMVPRFDPHNAGAVRVDALKPVAGLAAQAIARVSFDGAMGRIVGEPGRGLQVLRDVRTLTQLDSTIVAAGAARAALARAAHHARYRQSFGRPLVAEPLHARVLADLALDSAALTALAIRLAGAFDLAFERDGDHAIARVVTPAARILAFKTAPALAAEACEAIGAPAFLETHPAARIAADLAAFAQWDGTANETALDLAAMVQRDGAVLRDALDELGTDLGTQNDDLVEDVLALGERAAEDVSLARTFAEQLAMLAAASAMRRNLPRAVADAYAATRLRERFRAGYGALDGLFDATAILDFVVPED
jgi:putative acyl-CoA dehydrogenase